MAMALKGDRAGELGRRLRGAVGGCWGTAALALAAVALYPASFGALSGDFGWLLRQMTFVPMELVGNQYRLLDLAAVAARGEWWRLASPMFIHFGPAHLVFNLLWVWVVGQRIEAASGRRWLAAVVLASSLAANFMQYALSGPGLYGGLSGVVFGLFGHAFLFSRLQPARALDLPLGLYLVMLAFLLLGFTGLMDLLIPGSVANGAHLGGLLAGLATGALSGCWRQRA